MSPKQRPGAFSPARSLRPLLALKFPWACALAATFLLLLARLLHLSPLQDAATGRPLPSYSLRPELLHLLTTPLSSWADALTVNSLRQDVVLLVYFLSAYWLWRSVVPCPALKAIRGYLLYLAAVAAFLSWAALLPRPAVAPVLPDDDLLALDFHSHTFRSWDVRPGFSLERNLAWHARTGYRAAFITDHGVFADWISPTLKVSPDSEGNAAAARVPRPACRGLRGIEIGLQGTHIVLLGGSRRIDPDSYGGPGGLRQFLAESQPRHEQSAVMSLPEYWKHFPPERWEEFADGGAAGFEIVSAAPKAMDFPAEFRRKVVELCRQRGLFVAGASDQHGWGRAAYVWNVMRLPGHGAMETPELEKAILRKLRDDKFDAVQVVVRAKQEPLPFPWIALDPILGIWTLCRTFSWPQTLACLAWIWIPLLWRRTKPRGRNHGRP